MVILFLEGGEYLRNYNDLINIHNKQKEFGFHRWKFNEILDHKFENKRFYLKVRWDNDEVSWEPLNEIRLNDALKVAKYGTEHELTGKHGWK